MNIDQFLPQFRYLSPALIQVSSASANGKQVYCLADNMGFILPERIIQELMAIVQPFYDRVTDLEIEEANRDRLENPPHYMHAPTGPRMTRGFVYLVQCGPYYKIGISTQVDERIKQLSTLPPFDIELSHMIPTDDMYTLESTLHERFADKRKNGEWFELEPADAEYIKGLSGRFAQEPRPVGRPRARVEGEGEK